MCTSFVSRKDDVIVGMNFDNDGKEFRIVLKDHNQFVIRVKVGNEFFSSFGVNSQGTFINDLMVDGTEAGKYKRQNSNRWVTTSLIEKVLSEEVAFDDLEKLLIEKIIVNGPDTSTHCMAVNRAGSVHVIEPGRKNLYSGSTESPYYVMTNFPLSDCLCVNSDEITGCGADRYKKVRDELSKVTGALGIDGAFAILEGAKQDGKEWKTEFSMVFKPEAQIVYFSLNGDNNKRFQFSFENQQITMNKGLDQEHHFSLTAQGFTHSELEKL